MWLAWQALLFMRVVAAIASADQGIVRLSRGASRRRPAFALIANRTRNPPNLIAGLWTPVGATLWPSLGYGTRTLDLEISGSTSCSEPGKSTASRSNACLLQLGHFFPNLLDFLLDRQFIEARKR